MATVQERLAADTTSSGPGGTGGSMGGCRNVIVVAGRSTNERGKHLIIMIVIFPTIVQEGFSAVAC